MKIVSWNCHWGFDKTKADTIFGKFSQNDIFVIQECREMDMNKTGYDEAHRDWYGDYKEVKNSSDSDKAERGYGIGVFWPDNISINRHKKWDESLKDNNDFRYLIPYEVHGLKNNFEPFTLIAVWTKRWIEGDKNDQLEYVKKAHAAVDKYKEIGLLDRRVILIGDFNSDKIWDGYYGPKWSHSKLEKKLEENNIYDCSRYYKEKKYVTFYYYNYRDNNKEIPICDDYCFASEDIEIKPEFWVHGTEEWFPDEKGKKRWHGSDHCPISVEFNFSTI